MLRHVVPAALERYCALRNLSRAEAVDELARMEELLGPERPVLVHPHAAPHPPGRSGR
ncbi:MAG: hypothetical protein ACRDYV_09735 [Acidimicrobiia bacterium]